MTLPSAGVAHLDRKSERGSFLFSSYAHFIVQMFGCQICFDLMKSLRIKLDIYKPQYLSVFPGLH